MTACGTCNRALVSRQHWYALTAADRRTQEESVAVRYGHSPACTRCVRRERKTAGIEQDGTQRRSIEAAKRAQLLEDVEFMVETGESLTGACRRLGRNEKSLWVALKRAGCAELYRALAGREGRVIERSVA